MTRESLTKKIEIEFEGILRKEIFSERYWIEYKTSPSSQNKDLADAAIQVGYKVGESVKCKTIIEPKD